MTCFTESHKTVMLVKLYSSFSLTSKNILDCYFFFLMCTTSNNLVMTITKKISIKEITCVLSSSSFCRQILTTIKNKNLFYIANMTSITSRSRKTKTSNIKLIVIFLIAFLLLSAQTKIYFPVQPNINNINIY